MSDVSLSKAVRQNLLSLQSTADMMAKTQNRLATGNKVNSALDNPTNFFTASSLNSRAGDLGALLDGMANGIQTIEAADNGLKAITKTLESMQSTLRQARQDKSFQTTSLSLDAANVSGAAGETRALTFTGGQLGTDEVSIDLTKATNGSTTSGIDYAAPAASTGAAAITGSAAWGTDRDLSTPMAITIQGNNDASAITIDLAGASAADPTEVTLEEALAEINDQLNGAGSSIRAREGAGGELEFYDTDETNTGAAASITITASTDTDTLGLTSDDTTDAVSEGVAAETKTFNINGTAIELNGDDHGTAAQAATAINDALRAANADSGIVASVNDAGRLTISGPSDASGLTIDGADADDFFGATPVVTAATAAGDASGPVKTVDELVNEINSAASGLHGIIRASNDNGRLRIENLSTQVLEIDGASTNGTIDGTSSGATEVAGNSVRADLTRQYNELRDQLDKLADDASFNGINLLRGDNLKITFNETGTSEIDIQSKEGKSINAGTLGIRTNMEEADFDSDSTIDGFLAEVKGAINEVRSQASAFGSSLSIVENRQNFSREMINTLQTGAGNLTLADTNEEAANLLALQTRQQLSSTALSMASQADQAVLRLF